jgi:hypothetical protein
MTSRIGPGLREGAVVDVDVEIDNATDLLISGLVLGFLGPLVVIRPADGDVAGLSVGAAAYLVVRGDGKLQALGATVRNVFDGAFALQLKDSFRVGQRRAWSRVALALDVTLEPIGKAGAAPVATTTLDVSPGGVSVQRPDGMPIWPRYQLTLSGGHLGEQPIRAEATPARARPETIGLRFTVVEDADVRRLMTLVLERLTAADATVTA